MSDRMYNIVDQMDRNKIVGSVVLLSPEQFEAENLLRKIVQGYEDAPGEMYIPDFIDKYIQEAKNLLQTRSSK